MSTRKIDLLGAASIVVANMIGTGVFTSLGFQLFNTTSGFGILAIWLIGGVLAFLGALCYAELATRLPEDGGEYYFLSKIYHPALGFMAGFVSSTVGFAAPIAGAALALGAYVSGIFDNINPKYIGAIVVIIISLIHTINFKAGIGFQKVFTIIKVALVILFIGYGFINGNTQHVNFNPSDTSWKEIFSVGFAINLVWVSFAYSGWNASAYIAGEIKNPEKNLSRSILYGAGIVTVLYVLLNAVFMMSTPIKAMIGNKEVGLITSNFIFGETGGKIMGGIISILLVSTISSMIIAGPRVLQPMFSKLKGLHYLAATDKSDNPIRAIIFQTALSLILLFSVDFENLIYYIAFTLSLFTMLTVAGIFILRYKEHREKKSMQNDSDKIKEYTGYKAFGYPVTPILFILMTAGTCIFFIVNKTIPSLLGLSTAVVGVLLYFISDKPTENETN